MVVAKATRPERDGALALLVFFAVGVPVFVVGGVLWAALSPCPAYAECVYAFGAGVIALPVAWACAVVSLRRRRRARGAKFA
jgi:hypothetical protein